MLFSVRSSRKKFCYYYCYYCSSSLSNHFFLSSSFLFLVMKKNNKIKYQWDGTKKKICDLCWKSRINVSFVKKRFFSFNFWKDQYWNYVIWLGCYFPWTYITFERTTICNLYLSVRNMFWFLSKKWKTLNKNRSFILLLLFFVINTYEEVEVCISD